MNDFNNDSDLIRQLKNGDEFALKALFKRYADPVYRIAYAILKDTMASEDVVVEVIMKVWNTRSTMDEAGNLNAFIQVIAKRLTLNKFRNIQKERQYTVELENIDSPDPSETDQLTKSKELLELQLKVLNLLPPQQQLIFM